MGTARYAERASREGLRTASHRLREREAALSVEAAGRTPTPDEAERARAVAKVLADARKALRR